MDGLRGILLSEISQRRENAIWYPIKVESKKWNKLENTTKQERVTDAQNKLVVDGVEKEEGKWKR